MDAFMATLIPMRVATLSATLLATFLATFMGNGHR
jgi:hypothetical protein